VQEGEKRLASQGQSATARGRRERFFSRKILLCGRNARNTETQETNW